MSFNPIQEDNCSFIGTLPCTDGRTVVYQAALYLVCEITLFTTDMQPNAKIITNYQENNKYW